MSEERLQEIKDSVEFQKEILEAHNMNTLCVDEEQELVEEIERLNNIINELERYINEEYIYDELGMKIFDASELQDKLQELKGSDE